MLPKSLALIDDDKEYAEFLAQYLQEQGVRVDVFSDSNDLLVHADPYGYQFYLVDLMLPGIDGVDLIKLLRRRTSAGLLVVSGRLAPDVFKDVISAGADMYLTKPVQFEQVVLAIKAVHRRVGTTSAIPRASGVWSAARASSWHRTAHVSISATSTRPSWNVSSKHKVRWSAVKRCASALAARTTRMPRTA